MDNIKDKIAKLLATGQDDRGNESESETAMRLAEKLMRKHNISLSEVMERTGKLPDFELGIKNIRIGKNIPKWLSIMSSGIGLFTDTRASLIHFGSYNYVRFSGELNDLEYAEFLFHHLQSHCNKEAKSAKLGRSLSNSFRIGYAAKIQSRMTQYRNERSAVKSGGTALAVINHKLQLVEQKYGQQHYRSSSIKLDTGAYAQGKAAGDRATFGKQVSSQKAIAA